MLKDNFYLMEKKMRDEIHKDYRQQIIEKENMIIKMKEAFKAYKTELSADIKSNID
jgi:homoserine kinase